MISVISTIPLLILSGVYGSPVNLKQSRSQQGGIQWGPCNLNTTLPVQCAKLPVPLDYTDKNCSTMLDLDLIKYPAQSGTSKGTILLNFGGPGQDGLNNMLVYGPIQGPITGGQHDLISWDPRGTGNTLRFNCYPNDTTSGLAALGSTWYTSSDTAPGQLWAEGQIVAETCYETLKEVGDYVGMAYVARDMMQIVDALGEDGMLRYWGISGGTILGATAAALFPDRMDRVILDGVANSHEYYNSFETEFVSSSDDVFREFLSGCLDYPENCPLSKKGETLEDLEALMDELFENIKYNPFPFMGIVVSYSIVKDLIFSSLYRPAEYPTLSAIIDALVDRNLTRVIEPLTQRFSNNLGAQDQAVLGIRCGDKSARASNLTELNPFIENALSTSRWFGDFAFGPYSITCAQWKFQAKERYEGDFNVATKNPLLFIGNSYDPATPLVSANNMSAGFKGSAVLQHNGHGHLSIVQPSNCTIEAIQGYFLEGTLPEPGTVCEPNVPLFAETQTEA